MLTSFSTFGSDQPIGFSCEIIDWLLYSMCSWIAWDVVIGVSFGLDEREISGFFTPTIDSLPITRAGLEIKDFSFETVIDFSFNVLVWTFGGFFTSSSF